MSLKSRLNQIKNSEIQQEQVVQEPETDEILKSHPDVEKLMIFSYKEAYVKTQDGIFASNLKFSSPGGLLKEIKRVSGLAGVDFHEKSFFKINNGIVVKSFLPPLTKDVCGILSREPERQMQDSFINDEVLIYLKECVENQKNILITGPSKIDKEAFLSLLTELVDDEKTFVICDKYSKMKTERKSFVFSLFDAKSVAVTDYDTLFAAEPDVDEFVEIARAVLCGKKGIIAAMTLKEGDVTENLKMLLALKGIHSEEAENIIFSTFDVLINCGLDENETPYIRNVISTNPFEEIYKDPSEPEIIENSQETVEDVQNPEIIPDNTEADYVFDLSTPKKKAQILKDKIKRKKHEKETLVQSGIETEFAYGPVEMPDNVDFEEIQITGRSSSEDEELIEQNNESETELTPENDVNTEENLIENPEEFFPEENFTVETDIEEVLPEADNEITIEPEIIDVSDVSENVETMPEEQPEVQPEEQIAEQPEEQTETPIENSPEQIDVEDVELKRDEEVLPEQFPDENEGILPTMPVMTAKKTRITVRRKPGNPDKFKPQQDETDTAGSDDDLFDAPEEFMNNNGDNDENQ